MPTNEFLWVLTRLYCVLTDSSVSLWVVIGLYDSLLLTMGLYRSLCVVMDFDWSLFVLMDSNGCL